MAKSIKAFPNSSPFNSKEDGMDLRDYFAAMAIMDLRDFFAAMAMQGLIVEGKCDTLKLVCEISWGIADRMIKERENDNDLL